MNTHQSNLSCVPIKAFSDNYIWMLTQSNSTLAVIVDPGEAKPVISTLEASNLTLDSILITHHHADHQGGVAELKQRWPNAVVYGPKDTTKHCDHAVGEGDEIELTALQTQFTVLAVPGHTLDHIAYLTPGHLFCGDTLFSAGCGRVFEGTMEQMWASLDRLRALPANTQIYPAHEYTLANIRFAMMAEPSNKDLQAYQARCQALRDEDRPTLPSTIGLECAINPFLRPENAEIIKSASQFDQKANKKSVESVFSALRKWKNQV